MDLTGSGFSNINFKNCDITQLVLNKEIKIVSFSDMGISQFTPHGLCQCNVNHNSGF